MWSRTEGGCVEARRGSVEAEARRKGVGRAVGEGERPPERNGSNRQTALVRVCSFAEKQAKPSGQKHIFDDFERIPIERRVRARGAVGRYHAEFGAQECVSRVVHAYRSRVARVSSVVSPSLRAR